jgi:hypothetical protein
MQIPVSCLCDLSTSLYYYYNFRIDADCLFFCCYFFCLKSQAPNLYPADSQSRYRSKLQYLNKDLKEVFILAINVHKTWCYFV